MNVAVASPAAASSSRGFADRSGGDRLSHPLEAACVVRGGA